MGAPGGSYPAVLWCFKMCTPESCETPQSPEVTGEPEEKVKFTQESETSLSITNVPQQSVAFFIIFVSKNEHFKKRGKRYDCE